MKGCPILGLRVTRRIQFSLWSIFVLPGPFLVAADESVFPPEGGDRIIELNLTLLLSILIVAFLIQIYRRHRYELLVQTQRQELQQAWRLATVGELTASIGHQINQPLGAILNNAEAAAILLRQSTPKLEEIGQIINDIQRDSLRAGEIIRRIRRFSQKQTEDLEPANLAELIRDTLRLAEGEIQRTGTVVETLLPPDLPCVRMNRVLIQQVLLNLMSNALEAMVDCPPGRRRLVIHASFSSSNEVEVTVSDSGEGILPEQLDHLFTSFFTTKKAGLGLGLSIARSIVESHGGRIWARNVPDGGAIFHLTLPTFSPQRDESPSVHSPTVSTI
jgi:C4-dicarboxylate-specific signal transduction histidine kinase